jgi:4'-phosphopantetheinyl transferase
MKSMPDPPPDLTHWPVPDEHPSLRAGDVHVWILDLEATGPRVVELETLLSDDERARAARFKFPGLRRRHIVSHAGLRVILGRYLDRHPASLAFRYSERGKPSLDPGLGPELPEFNLSHSSELALVAVSPLRVVGVDLERQDWKDSLEDVAKRYFSSRECGILRDAPSPSEKADCFFHLWTMKEAILKATGEGITDLTRVEVLPELKVTGDEVDASRWTLHDLPPIAGFGAALAVEGDGARVTCWRWEG